MSKSQVEANLKKQIADHQRAQVQRAGEKIRQVLDEHSCELVAVVEFASSGTKHNVVVKYKDG